MPDLLIEIGCEELPAVACREAEAQLPQLLDAALERAGLAGAERRVHVAPRRLAALAFGLPEERAAERRETRGPRADAPEAARAGFARRHGLTPDQLEERDGLLWAAVEEPAVPASELVPGIVTALVEGLQFARSMRWDGGRFARPIRWLVVMLDGDVVPATAVGLEAGDTSHGHRTLAAAAARIDRPAAYLDSLRAVRVLADAGERRRAILEGLDAAGGWSDPMGVLEEVVYLVEWPRVLTGSFDDGFLELPERIVVTAMQSHQRYLPIRGADRRLLPRYAFVANGGERPDLVVAGNDEVLVGRLEDARFAHRRDLDHGIAAMAAELGRVSFLEGAGSLADKAERVASLVELLCERNRIDEGDRAAALRAAQLAKADLVSSLVSEFAELQGYAGSLYAAAAGEEEPVCLAVEQHHRPLEAGGETPTTLAGALVSVADKLDTVVAAFGLGAQPRGSRDPLGLRRAAAGVVGIVLERGLELDPAGLADGVLRGLVAQGATLGRKPLEVVPAAVAFLLDRLEGPLADEGVTVEELRAARGSGAMEPLVVAGLARALRERRGDGELAALRDAYGRCMRIAARDGHLTADELRGDLLLEPAERDLQDALVDAELRIAEQVAARRFADALDTAAGLVQPVARLFDEVLVMAEEPALRENRLRLVANVASSLRLLGDFDELPG